MIIIVDARFGTYLTGSSKAYLEFRFGYNVQLIIGFGGSCIHAAS